MSPDDDTTDEQLRRRLRAADPARSVRAPDDLAADLVRRTRERHESDSTQAGSAPHRRRWLPVAAAAAVLAVGGTAYVAAQGGADETSPPAAAPTVGELSLPEPGASGRCMQVDAATLAGLDSAFEATVAAVEESSVVLEVDRWYAGEPVDEVRLETPAGGARPALLPGQPEFEVGERWLVTAADGQVLGCGFTAPWSPRLAGLFDEAFAG